MKIAMINILAVNHSEDIGGGHKSFKLAFEMLINDPLINKIIYIKPNKEILKKNPDSITIPFDCSYLGSDKNKAKSIAYSLILYLLYIISSFRKIRNIIRKNKINIVYLNSYVLWPILICKEHHIKYIIHIREIIDKKRFPIITKIAIHFIRKCDKIICIDNISKKYLGINKAIVVRNPFDMKKVKDYLSIKEKIYDDLNICKKNLIFSIIGRVEEIKGVDFILNSSISFKDITFLVIGKLTKNYGSKCYRIYSKYQNIRFIDETNEIEKYYAISHCIVRGDPFFPLGRSVFEAIYSGCYVILPRNNEDDISEVSDLIGKRIFTYKPRSKSDLQKAVHIISRLNRYDFEVYDNLEENYLKMKEIIHNVIM